jgi:hypothetical protein
MTVTPRTIPLKDSSALAYLLGVQDTNAGAKIVSYKDATYGWTSVWDELDALLAAVAVLEAASAADAAPMLFDYWMEGQALADGVLATLTDAANWNTNTGALQTIRVTTVSTDWTLYLYCDSDGVSGLFQSYTVIDHGYANLEQTLDGLTYADNDAGKGIHLKFIDNAGANGATVSVYATAI